MVEPGLPGAAKLRGSYKNMHKNVLKSMNSYGVVLSMLATLSYTAFLQTPQPLDHSQSANSPSTTAHTFTSTWQKLFFFFNGWSFFLSVCGLLFFASTSFSPIMVLDFEGLNIDEDGDQVNVLAIVLPMFVYINFFFALSLTCSVAAYIFAGLATVHRKHSEQLPIILTSVIGSFVYIQALITFIRQSLNLWQGSIKKDTKLWDTLKQKTLFGKAFTWYLDLCARDLSRTSAAPAEDPQRTEDPQLRENHSCGSLSESRSE